MPVPELPAAVPDEVWPAEVPSAVLPLSLLNELAGAEARLAVVDVGAGRRVRGAVHVASLAPRSRRRRAE
jgi:hypothetical protein